jgi:hypothetical protein
MSDYLTNLVIRSFSPMASVQPMGASLYVAPDVLRGSFGELSDPFAEAASSGEDDSAEAEELTPQRKRSRDKPARFQAAIGEPPIKREQASSLAPFANGRSDSITPLRPEFPDPPQSAALPGRSHPTLSDESRAKLEEAPRLTASLESPIAGVTLASPEKPSEPAAPVRKGSDTGSPLVNPGLLPLQKERLEALPAVPTGIATFDESVTEENINPSTRAADRTNDNSYTFHGEPIDTGVSTWHLLKRPGKGGTLSPQTSPAYSTPPVSAAADKFQPPAVSGSVVERITAPPEERQQVKVSLTTLVPKVSAQPLLPVNVKTRPNLDPRRAPYEAAAHLPLTETIVNVAIGRIEVRATPAESPRRERQSKGPKVMNLDDYMQQRSRGNR